MPRLLPLLVLAVWMAGCTAAEGQRPAAERIRSVTLDARSAPEPHLLDHLRDLGVTHLTLISFGFQPGYRTPEIRLHNDARWYSESDAGIRALAAEAEARGMRLILKPHVWVGGYSAGGQERHAIGFATEEAWQAWEQQYHTFLMHYARLAAEVDAALLVVGTELANVAKTREPFWRRLIADVRAVYDGPLTYAANWWEEYEDVPFWDALDYVGVQAYFELSDAPEPSAQQLRAGWQPHVEALRRLADRTGRPILFTEIGYRNVGYAAAEPWRWPSRDEPGEPDDALQARLYDVFFETLWHEPWFAGAILWKWHPEADRQGRRGTRLDFSPQGRPAETVIARWFAGATR
ncbi:MAG: hypothetical protein R3247_10330 [Rhodothermales bacterium]|nr:hypothetical protein [Rhodothermales bacterium]